MSKNKTEMSRKMCSFSAHLRIFWSSLVISAPRMHRKFAAGTSKGCMQGWRVGCMVEVRREVRHGPLGYEGGRLREVYKNMKFYRGLKR